MEEKRTKRNGENDENSRSNRAIVTVCWANRAG